MPPSEPHHSRLGNVASAIVLILGLGLPMVAVCSNRPSVDTVGEGLTCQCGCGLTVANCNHPQCEFAVPVREQIEAMLKKGMSRTEILASFRTKYGEKILSAPTTEGFNLIAWIMPFAALFAGGGLIFFAFGRWRSRSSSVDHPTETTAPSFDPALRERLEATITKDI